VSAGRDTAPNGARGRARAPRAGAGPRTPRRSPTARRGAPTWTRWSSLSLRAYRVSSAEARRDFYTDHPRFGTKDVRVLELGDEVVASLVLYPLHAYVRGERIPLTGIGSVAVSPEHRRRGVADALLRSTLGEMRERGDGWSMLYPFRGEFYRRFGWGLIETPTMLSVPPAVLPASDEARHVRRARTADHAVVQALYERVAQARGHWHSRAGRRGGSAGSGATRANGWSTRAPPARSRATCSSRWTVRTARGSW
jgi:GNAT superfamily N-acetyltransferase